MPCSWLACDPRLCQHDSGGDVHAQYQACILPARQRGGQGIPAARCCSPFNSSERGAFDIRAGWAKSRRLVRLPDTPGAMQEVVQTELFLSFSGE